MRFTLLLALLSTPAFAAIHPYYEDIKLPTQQMIEKQSWAAPVTASSTYILSQNDGITSAAAATVSSFLAQPDFPRNLTLTASGPDYNKQAACSVVVNGTDYFNHAITESLVLAAGQSTVVTGSRAFRSVTSVVFPSTCESSAYTVKYNLGVGTKLGLKRCMKDAGGAFHAAADGVKETTAPTMAAASSVISDNTVITNTAPNSSRNFDMYFAQDYTCLY